MELLEVEDIALDVPGRRLFQHVSFSLKKGQTASVVGPSGSGKTSLLNCLCGVTRPTVGRVWLQDKELSDPDASARAALRLKLVGYVFQFGELLPELNVLENVALPMRLGGVNWREAEEQASRELDRVGLAALCDALPERLSGGEVQRAAIARALVGTPLLVLADEPTGALDAANAGIVCDLMFELAAYHDTALFIVTHNAAVAGRASIRFQLENGTLSHREDARAGSGQ